ncbi:DUF4367 domain-containing protein [Petralouisia muris]|uniref:DUF4367 domain-containing protein n=1 Tax=Petralouisia muris TaxID=3032872 RepID=A0AC61RY80_9FIRM|nr:DUF4367 domain-containing protein [Petralouisia muris]TGY96917.1 DUF4367 domain-containing protein [Petralouisia muris]
MDELLISAFEETAKDGYNGRVQTLARHRFSFKFYWNMHNLFQISQIRYKRNGTSIMELYRPIRSKRRLAVIVLLLLMLIGGSSVASEPLIRWLNNFYMEQNNDHVRFQNNENDISIGARTTFRKYCFVDVPEGYIMELEKFDEGFQRYAIRYINKEDGILSLKQTWQEEEYPENVTSDKEPMKDVEVNGFTGYYVEDNGMGSLIISNGVYKLVLDGPFSKKELIELAGKLELSNDPIE